MYPPTDNAARYRKAVHETALMNSHYACFNTRIIGGTVVQSRGRVRPTETSAKYRVEVVYEPWSVPKVRVIDPEIKFAPEIHMFRSDDTLCLYDHRETPWQRSWHLYDTVVPWTAEWLLFYELFLETGKWLGPSALHGAPPAPKTEEEARAE